MATNQTNTEDQLKLFVDQCKTPFTIDAAIGALALPPSKVTSDTVMRIGIALRKLGCEGRTVLPANSPRMIRIWLPPSLKAIQRDDVSELAFLFKAEQATQKRFTSGIKPFIGCTNEALMNRSAAIPELGDSLGKARHHLPLLHSYSRRFTQYIGKLLQPIIDNGRSLLGQRKHQQVKHDL